MSRPLPRYTEQQTPIDTVAIAIAQREAKEHHARQAILAGRCVDANPADLRGIPCIARGTGGTSPGTDPLRALMAKERNR